MIIHAYLTSGFLAWANLFVESFKYYHGDTIKIILSSRDLKQKQIDKLMFCYDNLQVINKQFDITNIAKKSKVSVDTLLQYKKQVETKHVTQKSKVWKNIIADDDRIKEIYEVMNNNIHEKYMLHFDIDMYFREYIKDLFDLVKNNDISIALRLKSKITRKTMIAVQGYKLNNITLNFMKEWIKNIDSTPANIRPAGYGQQACYLAYEKFKKTLSWGNVIIRFRSPRMLQTDAIWSANTTIGKEKTLKLFYKDFEEIKQNEQTNDLTI